MPRGKSKYGGASTDWGTLNSITYNDDASMLNTVGQEIATGLEGPRLYTDVPARVHSEINGGSGLHQNAMDVQEALRSPVFSESSLSGGKTKRKVYEKCTKKELLQKAKTRNVKGTSSMSKPELIKHLRGKK